MLQAEQFSLSNRQLLHPLRVLGLHHFKKAQMTKPMIKIATTRAASGLSCSTASISFTQTAPVRPNVDQIVLGSKGRRAYLI